LHGQNKEISERTWYSGQKRIEEKDNIMDYTKEQITGIKELLYKIADDQLILGHRLSEWTGLGPILEEDIAFSSIAQDKIGQSNHIYNLLHELGEKEPDTIAFTRNANEFKCCQFVEYPIGEYDFSLIRNFLFNHSEALRFEMLSNSTFEPIAKIAKKIKGEIKYHTMHADTWINQLGNGTEESNARLQKVLYECFNNALGIFEPGSFENILIELNIFSGETELRKKWLETIRPVINKANLKLPDESEWKPSFGGRCGKHTEFLQPMLEEMGEVFRIEPEAEW
jgi:ring-1,2-phenylacetyl-CoA epoxidase subunit PaaC